MAKDFVTVQPLRLMLEAAKMRHPEIAAEGNNYLVDCALAAFAGLPYPKPPRERMSKAGMKLKKKSE